MAADVPFSQRQPGYLQAALHPETLRGYVPKNTSIPAWLDYALYGPPAVRDSSPDTSIVCWVFAVVFGRTEHDKQWNPKKKSALTQGFNSLCLVFMYILFMYLPWHYMYFSGIKPYHGQTPEVQLPSEMPVGSCKGGFLVPCSPGCVRSGIFKCVAPS